MLQVSSPNIEAPIVLPSKSAISCKTVVDIGLSGILPINLNGRTSMADDMPDVC